MKRILPIVMILFLSTTFTSFAQKSKTDERPEIIRDRLMVDVFHSFWMGAPSQVNTNKLHPGFNVSAMWDFKMPNKLPLSFGLGVGATYYTQFSDALLQKDPTTTTSSPQMLYYVLPKDDDFEYKLNRLNYVSCNIPFEFRYRHQSGFKVNVGIRLGLVAEISQTYRGDNPDGVGEDLARKSFEIYGKMKYNFDVYMRAGWKYVSLYYCYQVTSLFENGKGPKMSPMSLGVTWNIF